MGGRKKKSPLKPTKLPKLLGSTVPARNKNPSPEVGRDQNKVSPARKEDTLPMSQEKGSPEAESASRLNPLYEFNPSATVAAVPTTTSSVVAKPNSEAGTSLLTQGERGASSNSDILLGSNLVPTVVEVPGFPPSSQPLSSIQDPCPEMLSSHARPTPSSRPLSPVGTERADIQTFPESDTMPRRTGKADVPSLSSPSPATQVEDKRPPATKRSWVDCVTGKSQLLQKKGAKIRLESGKSCVKIPNAVIARNKKAWASFVLGQFHGTLPSMGALYAILNGIWSNKNKDISISRAGEQSVLIKIPNPVTRQRVLDQAIWQIEGQSMFVGAWEPGMQPETPELKEVPVWVDFKGVPPHFFSAEGMEYIAGLVGQPLYLHPRTAAMTNLEVARVFTLVDLTEEFPDEVYVMFESGKTQRIEVSCQWLPPKCSHCDRFGHSLRRCPTAPITCSNCRSTTHDVIDCNRNKSNPGVS